MSKYENEPTLNELPLMIDEFVTLTNQLGIKTIDDASRVCRWFYLKEFLEKKGLIEFQ